MVVVEIEGVVKLVLPESKSVPPEAASYQSIVLPAEVAVMAIVPVPHLELLPAVGAAGTAFTVAVTAVLVGEIQPVVVFLAWA